MCVTGWNCAKSGVFPHVCAPGWSKRKDGNAAGWESEKQKPKVISAVARNMFPSHNRSAKSGRRCGEKAQVKVARTIGHRVGHRATLVKMWTKCISLWQEANANQKHLKLQACGRS